MALANWACVHNPSLWLPVKFAPERRAWLASIPISEASRKCTSLQSALRRLALHPAAPLLGIGAEETGLVEAGAVGMRWRRVGLAQGRRR